MLKQIETLTIALNQRQSMFEAIAKDVQAYSEITGEVWTDERIKAELNDIKEARKYLKAHEQNAKHIEKATANPWPWYGDSLFDELEGGDLW